MHDAIRGYQLASTIDYIESPTFSPEQRLMIYEALPPDVSHERSAYDDMKWYPVRPGNELKSAIAAVYGADEQRVFTALEGLGTFMADRATSTFLRLLLKILTPGLFAKKVPNFWARDNRVGTMTADTSMLDENRLVVHLRDVKPLVHAVPPAVGFAKFAMTAIGMKEVKIVPHGWSLTIPDPDAAHFEISWS